MLLSDWLRRVCTVQCCIVDFNRTALIPVFVAMGSKTGAANTNASGPLVKSSIGQNIKFYSTRASMASWGRGKGGG